MEQFSRREFLQLVSYSGAGFFLNPFLKLTDLGIDTTNKHLGRVTEPFAYVRSKPDIDSPIVETLNEDTVIQIEREVIGKMPYSNNQLWVETSKGYIWSPILQRVKNISNSPIQTLADVSNESGMWVEVTVPWVDVVLDNQIPFGPRIKYLIENYRSIRLYFSQIVWVDLMKTDENEQILYHLVEPYGSYGDRFWGPARSSERPDASSPRSS